MIGEGDASDIAYHMPFLEEWASRSALIVEIGVGTGTGSTRAFTRGLLRSDRSAKLHVLVDIDPERPHEKPAHEWWKTIYGPSEDVLTRTSVEGLIDDLYPASIFRSPDIIFIDTIHDYEHMSKELAIWPKIASPRTLWAFHDTWIWGVYNHMTEAIKDWAASQPEGWEYFDQSKHAHGLGVMRHKDGPWVDIQPRDEVWPTPQV